MSYRVRRKFTSSKFFVDGQLCKVFLEPLHEFAPGHWLWNVGFAIGKSPRQLNDWYHRRKNKRRRSVDRKFHGRSGIKALNKGFAEVRRLRWNLAPGDCLVIDCTSGAPAKQYKVFDWLRRNHPDFAADPDAKEFYWHRPPFVTDHVWKYLNVVGVTPPKPLENTGGLRYYDCFQVRLQRLGSFGSTHRIADLLDLAQASEQ